MTKLGLIGISKIVTICAYSSISRKLALGVEILMPNFWTCKNGAVSTSLAPLARRWHIFIFPDIVAIPFKLITFSSFIVNLFVKYCYSFKSTSFHRSCKTSFISFTNIGIVSNLVISFFIYC